MCAARVTNPKSDNDYFVTAAAGVMRRASGCSAKALRDPGSNRESSHVLFPSATRGRLLLHRLRSGGRYRSGLLKRCFFKPSFLGFTKNF